MICSMCGKKVEGKGTYCSRRCAMISWKRRHPVKALHHRKGKLNGKYCQRCEEKGIKTPLRDPNRFNCPDCWVVLNSCHETRTFKVPTYGEVAWR